MKNVFEKLNDSYNENLEKYDWFFFVVCWDNLVIRCVFFDGFLIMFY